MPGWSAFPLGFYGLGTSKSWMFLWVFQTGCSPVVVEMVVVLVVYCENDLNVSAQDNETEFVHLLLFEDVCICKL